MQENLKKILCFPINWFIRGDELHTLPTIHFVPAYISILVVLIGFALAILIDIGLLVLGWLYCSTGQWFMGLKSIFCFITINAFSWWVFTNKERVCAFINRGKIGRKSNDDPSH